MRNKVAKAFKRVAKEDTADENPVNLPSGSYITSPEYTSMATYPMRRADYKKKKRRYMQLNSRQRTAYNAS